MSLYSFLTKKLYLEPADKSSGSFNLNIFHYSLLFFLILFNTLAIANADLNNKTCQIPAYQGTGELGIVIERQHGSILIINTTEQSILCRVTGLGDLSHASAVFSRDERYAYVFGRDGGLSKIDLLKGQISKRIIQSGNSIGGAITQNGRYVAVSNYEPGGVNIFSADDLTLVSQIPATYGKGNSLSKTVGLVDAPANQLLFSLYDADEIWQLQLHKTNDKELLKGIKKYKNIGKAPYDALISSNGRYYIAGLFGEDGLALLDLWHPEKGVVRILDHYGRGAQKLPVYKMPHLEGWAIAGNRAFLPAIGHHEVLVVDTSSWQEITRIKVHSQPVFAMTSPDERQIWINFAFPDNDTLQVIDSESFEIIKEFKPGKGILHMEFTPRSDQVWVSVRDNDEIVIYDTDELKEVKRLKAKKPSGIFFTARAHQTGL